MDREAELENLLRTVAEDLRSMELRVPIVALREAALNRAATAHEKRKRGWMLGRWSAVPTGAFAGALAAALLLLYPQPPAVLRSVDDSEALVMNEDEELAFVEQESLIFEAEPLVFDFSTAGFNSEDTDNAYENETL